VRDRSGPGRAVELADGQYVCQIYHSDIYCDDWHRFGQAGLREVLGQNILKSPITQIIQTSISCCRATRATRCNKERSDGSNCTELDTASNFA